MIPAAPMLMIVPLMIWSTRALIESQACSSETSIPAAIAAMAPISSGRVDAEDRQRLARAEDSDRGHTHHPADEGRR